MKICHYCEKEIKEDQEQSSMKSNKTGQVIYLHYPDCKVRFTTFYKTRKESIREIANKACDRNDEALKKLK